MLKPMTVDAVNAAAHTAEIAWLMWRNSEEFQYPCGASSLAYAAPSACGVPDCSREITRHASHPRRYYVPV
ncbi:MAG: hypothetical protein QOK33_1276 [Mycobacterium sp.]|jgi:hypothetical protein|nr:hypothetical protein [Mycobacterium sp.]